MFTISPQWLLKQLGISDKVDPETAEMATMLLMRYQSAPDKSAFLKDALRKALFVNIPESTSPGATKSPKSSGRLPRRG